jgi:TatD DNase family protein
VLQRAAAAGVAAIVVTGCTVASAKAARDLCDAMQVGEACGAGCVAIACAPQQRRLLHHRGCCCCLLQDFPLFFTAGVHPHNAKDCDDTTLSELRQLASHTRCVAVGACVTVHVVRCPGRT